MAVNSSFRVAVFISLIALKEISAINILVFVPGTTDWEKKPLNRIAQDLTFRNHGVATFRGIIIPEEVYLVKQKVHGAREMRIATGVHKDMVKDMSDVMDSVPFIEAYDTVHYNIPSWTAHANACDTIVNSDLMMKFREDKFDVALVYSGNPCNLAMVWALNIPYIYFDREGFSDDTMLAAGVPLQPGIIPSARTTYTQNMNFWQRWHNIWMLGSEVAAFSGIPFLANLFNPRYKLLDGPTWALYQKDYEINKMHPNFPDISQIKREAALYFVNSDPAIEFSGRASMPNVIYVGGQHIDYPRPLFDPYNSTNRQNKDGVIVFSLGTAANSSAMPDAWKEAFKTVFRKLPSYRIYWRVGSVDEDVSHFPSNVNASVHLPQADLIAAPETKLLITNGGMNSILEAVAYGKPIIGIPLYGSNYHNLRKVEAKGIAKIVDKNDISANTLLKTIKEVLDGKKYTQAARRVSRAYRDRTQTPFERMVHWIEKVGRNKGSEYLDSPVAKQQSLFTALYFDVITVLSLVIIGLRALVSALISAVTGGGSKPAEKASNQRHSNKTGVPPKSRKGASEDSDKTVSPSAGVKSKQQRRRKQE